MATESKKKKLCVLCLHGAEQDAEIFKHKTEHLRKHLSDIADFTFFDAPHLLPKRYADDTVNLRSWRKYTDTSTSKEEELDQGNEDDAWKDSLQLLSQRIANHDIDVLFGFSQGCELMLRSELLRQQQKGEQGKTITTMKGLIFCGAPLPDFLLQRPSSTSIEEIKTKEVSTTSKSTIHIDHDKNHNASLPVGSTSASYSPMTDIPSIHIIGQQDAICPPQYAFQLAELYFLDAEIILHDHGHSVPQTSKVAERIYCFLQSILPPEDFSQQMESLQLELEMLMSVIGEEEAKLTKYSSKKSREGGPSSTVKLQNNQLPGPQQQYEFLQNMTVLDIFLLDRQQQEIQEIHNKNQNASLSWSSGHIFLKFIIPLRYPDEIPTCSITGAIFPPGGEEERKHQKDHHPIRNGKSSLSSASVPFWVSKIQSELYDVANALRGTPMLLALYGSAKDLAEAAIRQHEEEVLGGGNAEVQGVDDSASSILPRLMVEDPWAAIQYSREYGGQVSGAEILEKERDHQITEAYLLGTSPSSSNSTSASGSLPTKSSAGGMWKYVIGLVGKPSAGKSTFFNAVTNPESEATAAKVGHYPFTTLEPNIGQGFVATPCACQTLDGFKIPSATTENEDTKDHTTTNNSSSLSGLTCHAKYGHFPNSGMRRTPITIKDVAGLVPGAYLGRGKGNRFLNDLCDADVLVHVVDGSGLSSVDGVHVGGMGNKQQQEDTKSDPSASSSSDPEHNSLASAPHEDITWIRNEIHNWIFDNVAAKWEIIRRKPMKLLSMFSGYHTKSCIVEEAIHRATGVKVSQIPFKVPAWSPKDLHFVVAQFVMLRFPMVMAFNKADAPSFNAHFKEAQRKHPSEAARMVPMCARLECELLQLRKDGMIAYLSGDNEFNVTVPKPSLVATRTTRERSSLGDNNNNNNNNNANVDVNIKTASSTSTSSSIPSTTRIQQCQNAIKVLGGTGVVHVLQAAIQLRPACYVFPVKDFHGYQSALANSSSVGANSEPSEPGAHESATASYSSPSFASLHFVLRDCLLMEPGSDVQAVFNTLLQQHLIPEGKLVRSEGIFCGEKRIMVQQEGGIKMIEKDFAEEKKESEGIFERRLQNSSSSSSSCGWTLASQIPTILRRDELLPPMIVLRLQMNKVSR